MNTQLIINSNLLQLSTENESRRKDAEIIKEEKTSLESQLESTKTEISNLREELLKSSGSEEVIKKSVRKIINKAFKSLRSEMSGDDETLKQIAFHFRNVTDQLLQDNINQN